MTDNTTPATTHGMQSLLFFVHAAALGILISDMVTFFTLLRTGQLEAALKPEGASGLDDLVLFFAVLMALCLAASGGYMACVRYRLGGLFGVAARLNCLLAALMALVVAYSGVVGTEFQVQYTAFALLWALSLFSLRHGFGPETDRSFTGLFRSAGEYTLGLFVRRSEP